MGIKIGRYHIFLPRMFKPKAVTLRTTLWRIYNEITSDLIKTPKLQGKQLIQDTAIVSTL